MSDVLFDRKVAVAFGPRGKLGKAFTELRVKFKVEKTSIPSPNKAEIMIYNLNKDSRALAEQNNMTVRLDVGYGQTVETIFSGDVAKAWSELDKTDYITHFEVGDGEAAFQTSRVDLSFADGTSYKDVFKKVLDSFTGGAAADLSAVKDGSILGGLSLSGLFRKHMDVLTAKQGLEWSIQDGRVQILAQLGNTKNQAVLLTSDTGLIGIPKKKQQQDLSPGLEFVSLLQPKIKPGGVVQIGSLNVNGFFRVTTVTHEGDTHDKNWYSTCESIPAANIKAAT